MISCQKCHAGFEVTQKDFDFYQKMSPVLEGVAYPLPAPKLCPPCREQRRLSFRNERHLYTRPSSLSGKPIISTYPANSPYTVYGPDEWWSDRWNGLDFGQDFDFNRPFFEQFSELWKKVPQISLLNTNNENAEYSNFSEQEKDCYLTFACNRNKNCYYCSYTWDSERCMDCLNVERCQFSYMCVDCINCYQCFFSQNCQDSSNLSYSYDCRSCHDCFACAGLRKKGFCILNREYTEEEYRRILSDPQNVQNILKEFVELKAKSPRLFANLTHCEDVLGSNLRNCRHATYAFDCFDSEDIQFAENCPGGMKDSYDISGSAFTELGYELVSVAYGYNLFSCLYTHTALTNSYYCVACPSSSQLFGCIGLKKQTRCVLNKQYSEEEYPKLVKKIIEHMQKTGEWGEFFPASISPYDYADTVAQERYPLPIQSQSSQTTVLYVQGSLVCQGCQKNYKFIPQEEQFYKAMQIPKPPLCPNCRHQLLLKERLPKRLWPRACSGCAVPLQSPYEPSRPESVFCEECYLGKMY